MPDNWYLYTNSDEAPAAQGTCLTARQDAGPPAQCQGCSSVCAGAAVAWVVVAVLAALILRKVWQR